MDSYRDINTSNWIGVRSIKKLANGQANHGDVINLEKNGIKFVNPKILLIIHSLELEGNTQRVFCQANKVGINKFEIIVCASTTTNLHNIGNSGVSTKYGTVRWSAFESD